MKYARIEELRQHHPVAAMCRILDVSQSGYHAWRQRPPSAWRQETARLETEIKAAHRRTRETYVPQRLQSDLAEHSIQASAYSDRIDSHRLAVTRAVNPRAHRQGVGLFRPEQVAFGNSRQGLLSGSLIFFSERS